MNQVVKEVEDSFKAKKITAVKSGDTVKVSQRIKEGDKERVQIFEGLVINTRRKGSNTFTITVRRIASGVGVEKTFQPHSPLVEKIEVVKRSKVRRNRLSYMRGRSGKAARMASVNFDSDAVNFVPDVEDKFAPKTAEDLAPKEEVADDGQSSNQDKEVEEKSVKNKDSDGKTDKKVINEADKASNSKVDSAEVEKKDQETASDK